MAMFGVPQYDPRAQFAGFGGMPQSMQQPQPGPMAGFGGLTPAMQAGTPPQIDMGKQPGMFAASGRSRPGIDIGQLGAMILAANGNPLGQAAIQAQAHQREQEVMLQRQLLLHQQEMADAFTQHQRERQYDAQNPLPDALERYMAGAGIDPHSPRGIELYRSAATNSALGPVTMGAYYDPATGQSSVVPMRGGAPVIGSAPHVMTDEEMRAFERQGGPSGSPPRAPFHHWWDR